MYDDANRYGVKFDGTLVDHTYHEQVSSEWMTLAELSARGGRITRLRILAESRRGDVSYCHGTLQDGTIVHVTDHPGSFHMTQIMGELIEWAKASRVYAKGLGLLDRSNWSVMYER